MDPKFFRKFSDIINEAEAAQQRGEKVAPHGFNTETGKPNPAPTKPQFQSFKQHYQAAAQKPYTKK